MSDIDDQIRDLRKLSMFNKIKESRTGIIFALIFIGVLSWNIYKSSDKAVASENIIGVLVGVHQSQGSTGSSTTMMSIKLSDNQNVIVVAPINFTMREDAKIELSKVITKQGSTYYHFIRYKD